MKMLRVLSTAARSAPARAVSQRSFAVGAAQSYQHQWGESGNPARIGGLLAAAAGASALVASGDRSADCCGIAGVVGGKGDAR